MAPPPLVSLFYNMSPNISSLGEMKKPKGVHNKFRGFKVLRKIIFSMSFIIVAVLKRSFGCLLSIRGYIIFFIKMDKFRSFKGPDRPPD